MTSKQNKTVKAYSSLLVISEAREAETRMSYTIAMAEASEIEEKIELTRNRLELSAQSALTIDTSNAMLLHARSYWFQECETILQELRDLAAEKKKADSRKDQCRQRLSLAKQHTLATQDLQQKHRSKLKKNEERRNQNALEEIAILMTDRVA